MSSRKLALAMIVLINGLSAIAQARPNAGAPDVTPARQQTSYVFFCYAGPYENQYFLDGTPDFSIDHTQFQTMDACLNVERAMLRAYPQAISADFP